MKKLLIILFIGIVSIGYGEGQDSFVTKGTYKEAESDFRTYQKYMEAGDNSYFERDYSESLNFYLSAFKVKKDNIESLYGVALSYEGLKEIEKALGVYRKILKLNPKDTKALQKKLTLNKINVHKWGYDKKEEYFEEFENYLKKTNYVNREDIYILGSIYMNDKSFERAYIVFKKDRGGDYRNYFGAATTARFLGKYDTAILFYNKLLSIKPNFYRGYLGLGNSYQMKGNYEKAIENMEKYLVYQEDENIYVAMANIYMAEDKYSSAKDVLENAQAKFPNSKKVRKNLGYIYSKLGRN
ncbi:MAG: tetratricopeptide repeat protein [Psychrilyobacter sp.]|uniref:tetratricopeptide repeat protein n=1 Tax=Psychrilyobacter sp. TaxID=2586924 RepID=UPI003C7121CC